MRELLQYLTFPLMVIVFMGGVVWLVSAGAPLWSLFAVLGCAIATMFLIEHVIPYEPSWNRSQGDALRDWLHAIVNTGSNHAGLLLLPLIAAHAPFSGYWPRSLPFWLQVVGAILVLDFGIAAAHHLSHRWSLLWRFHAVHHSVKRLYGFNGLMKHPIHQAVETAAGVAPLLLLGIPADVAMALLFCVAIQLLLQHSNADYRTGLLAYAFANAEVHRFHHRRGGGQGDVNFGLFTTLYDHVAGTFFHRAGAAPRSGNELGIENRSEYPKSYLGQLIAPFRDD